MQSPSANECYKVSIKFRFLPFLTLISQAKLTVCLLSLQKNDIAASEIPLIPTDLLLIYRDRNLSYPMRTFGLCAVRY